MLFYYVVSPRVLPTVQEDGIKGPVRLKAVQPDMFSEKDVILIVDPLRLQMDSYNYYGAEELSVPRVLPEAIANLNPYLMPELVIAGGGFVLKRGNGEPNILLIYRRGKWDIPKGKMDKGESFEQCAVREVQEEVGISEIEVVRDLGSTWHCYERKGTFSVKQTFWYEMKTSSVQFEPQLEEDIERVDWFSWSKAKEMLGFPVLSQHMTYVEPLVLS